MRVMRFRHLLWLLPLIAWLYGSSLVRLVLEWVGPAQDPDFQHGIVVPFFALYVLWSERTKLKSVALEQSWTGLPVVLLGLFVLVVGRLGAEIFLSRVSFVILLAGLILLFAGRAFFRAVLFPWAVLFLMIPPPKLLLLKIAFPLQLFASQLATAMLRVAGVVVNLQGNVIQLVSGQLFVEEACDGLRSLVTLVTLAVIYGYLMERRVRVRVALVFLAIPIAVFANGIRIFGTGVLMQRHPEMAQGFYHTFQGLVIFIVALLAFFACHRVIEFFWSDDGPASTGDAVVVAPLTRHRALKPTPVYLLILAIVMVATAVALQFRSKTETFPPRESLNSLPLQMADWQGIEGGLDEKTLKVLGHPEYVYRAYSKANEPQAEVELLIVYFASQREGQTIHVPDRCLPGNGWIATSKEVVPLSRPDNSSFLANRWIGAEAGKPSEIVLYWFQAHGRAEASPFISKYHLLSDSIRMNRSDGALVRLNAVLLSGESPEEAQARVMKLGSLLFPLLDTYIPR